MSLNNCSCNRKVYLSSIKNIYQADMQKRISFCLKEGELEGKVVEMDTVDSEAFSFFFLPQTTGFCAILYF